MTDARNRQPKGIPVGGEFAANAHDEAGNGLAGDAQDDIFAEAAKPLTVEETMEMVQDRAYTPERKPMVVAGRFVDLVPPTPSLRIDRDRPTFTDEKEFAYALSRIDGLWSKDDSIDGRSEKIIADMRRSGALGEGAGSAREAYARALVLNEAGYIDEERVNHLLDHIESGGVDYKNQARSFGYHPEQFLSDLHSASDAAGYRSDHASSDDAQRAARQRAGILDAEARRFAASANRGWTSLEEDTERYRNAVRVLDEKLAGDLSAGAKDKKVAAVIDHNNRIDITAERDAYAFMLNKIEGRWTND